MARTKNTVRKWINNEGKKPSPDEEKADNSSDEDGVNGKKPKLSKNPKKGKKTTSDEENSDNSSQEKGVNYKKRKLAKNPKNEDEASFEPQVKTFIAGKNHKELEQPEVCHYTSEAKRAYDDYVAGKDV